MHLDEAQRRQAMPNLAALVRPDGTHHHEDPARAGPAGTADVRGRRQRRRSSWRGCEGLHPVLNVRTESSQEKNRAAGVSWINLALVKTRE